MSESKIYPLYHFLSARLFDYYFNYEFDRSLYRTLDFKLIIDLKRNMEKNIIL